MTYAALHTFCQQHTPPLKRGDIYDKVLNLTGKNKVRHMRTSMDVAVCRGFYLSAKNQDHQFVRQAGTAVIVTARGLNRCWERFVFVKELMHLLDDADSAVDNGEVFDSLLGEIQGPPPPELSGALLSEMKCFWRALGVLCPEKNRLEFEQDRANSKIDDYSIALQIRIPQQYVPRLFEPRFPEIVKNLCEGAE